jgi:hypothetical protein
MISEMADSDFNDEKPSEHESRSRFASILMNLAFLLSKTKNLNQE